MKTEIDTEKNNAANARLFRILLYTVLALVALSVLFFGAAYYKYRGVLKADPGVEVLEKVSYQDTLRELAEKPEVALGDELQAVATFRVPWNKSPVKAELHKGEGIEVAQEAELLFDRYQWGSNIWSVRALILPYLNGDISPGSITVTFRNDSPGGSGETVTLPLPPIRSKLPEVASDELELAPEMTEPVKDEKLPAATAVMMGLCGLIIIVTVILAVLTFLKKAKKENARALWEVTLDEMAALRSSVKNNARSPEQAIATLTLILRDFLEQQFSLRAGRQTTTEFLREMDQDDSPLKDSDRRFLKKFLVAADLVKFAGVSAEKEAFYSAADQAEKMIRSAAGAEKGETQK